MLRLITYVFIALRLGTIGFPQVTLTVPSANFVDIQTAIASASHGDTVLVSPGTYLENIDFQGKDILVRGSGIGVSIIDGGGVGSVVTFDGNGSGVLEGFTVQNGLGTFRNLGNGSGTWGGGIVVWGQGIVDPNGGVPIIKNCEIVANAAEAGAGLAVGNQGAAIVEDCLIHGNIATFDGGGCWQRISGLSLRRNHIFGNQATRSGGGVASDHGTTIEDCIIEGNIVLPPLTNCPWGGGGVVTGGDIVRTVIRNNSVLPGGISTPGTGGGIFTTGTISSITDTVVSGNSAPEAGGISFWFFSQTNVTNCTIANNNATVGGGALHLENSATANVENSIVWGNSGPSVVSNFGLTTLNVTRSNFQGGGFGPGNFDRDPRFLDPAAGNYRLRGDSPCVGRGDTNLPHLGTLDFEGDLRVIYGSVDIGADEMSDASRDSASAGNVVGAGSPEQVLHVAGATGSQARRVTVRVGQQFRISMSKPMLNTGLARFAIYGLLRTARYDDVIALPGGIGSMVFPPCILLPTQQPTLFTLTNNFPIGPCGSLIPSTPAPWTSQAITIPIPFTFTIQGLIEETPGVVRTTNAVIVEVR